MIFSAATLGVGGMLIGQYGFGLALGGIGVSHIANGIRYFYLAGKTATTVHANGEILRVTRQEIHSAQLIWSEQQANWSLLLPRKNIFLLSKKSRHLPTSDEALDFVRKSGREGEALAEIQGQEATRALGKILATVNSGGGRPKVVQSAVGEIESVGEVERFLVRTARMFAANRSLVGLSIPEAGGNLKAIRTELRLAMEMAANEENERRALESELKLLEEEWRAAEEIAAISDSLLVSSSVQEDLQVLKQKNLKS